MKWTLFVQQKTKVAMLLFCVMFFVILTNILGSRNIDSINRSVNSMYNDRLVPATDVYYMSDHLHTKKALLESMLLTGQKNNTIVTELKKLDAKINSLISHFETTVLLNSEPEFIKAFKTTNAHYNRAESNTISLIAEGNLPAAKNVFDKQIKTAHEKGIFTLGKLMNIQSEVSRDLIKQSQFNTTSFNLLSALQIIVAAVIGALIVKLVMASRLTAPPTEKYTMN